MSNLWPTTVVTSPAKSVNHNSDRKIVKAKRKQKMPKERLQEEMKAPPKPKFNELGPATMLIKHPCRLIFSGRSTMGKTTLSVDVICTQLLPSVKRCYAVCPTFWQQDALAKLRNVHGAFPKDHVYTRATNDVFDRIFRHLDRTKHIPSLLFVDDAAAERATNDGNKGAFARLCLAAPHLNLSIVGSFQRLTQCSPALRDNCEGLISFLSSTEQETKTLLREFCPPAMMDSKGKKKLLQVLIQCWEQYRFCFIWREKFTGHVFYHAGFQNRIQF